MKSHAIRAATVLILLSGFARPSWAAPDGGAGLAAAGALIARVLPEDAAAFRIESLPSDAGRDVFEVEGSGGKIVLRGNSGVSIASALNCYLKEIARCDLTWCGSNLALPHPLPGVPSRIRRVSPYRYRYYLNYCTFSYSMAWWDWDRWQREIDWMALNGINLPLALTGQNAVLRRVYRGLGFSDADLAGFFSGPAYFAWFWMGNLDGWGGPLPAGAMDRQEALQKRILARERELGMTPVLPAFAGHVPPGFGARFPKAVLKRTRWNGDFPEVALLDPSDPAFVEIGRRILAEEVRTFGTDHFYSADTFNENRPPRADPTFLAAASRQVYRSMAAADPRAVWVMQGWLFQNDRDFWRPDRVKALLDGVPDDRMVVLDLFADAAPAWKWTGAFCGKPWIWCMLHNFGGRTAMSGRFPVIAADPAAALADPKTGRLQGIGLAPEAIGQNPVVYELMLENAWTDRPIEVSAWLRGYVRRRYGADNPDARAAWDILARTAYSGRLERAPESIVTARPTFEPDANFTHTELGYDPRALLPAWDHLIAASAALGRSDGFRYDLVDLTRQVLANRADELQQDLARDWAAGDLGSFRSGSRRFLALIDDLDRLLATRREFLLGPWLEAARRLGTDPEEGDLFERNARDQITLWGGPQSTLHDYAAKQWSGLLEAFYKPRWERFLAQREQALRSHARFDQDAFERRLGQWEWQWVNGRERHAQGPTGDPVAIARELYARYRPAPAGSRGPST